MEKVNINKIFRSDKDKKGNPYINKDGRPYTRVGIQTNEYGDKWLSGFSNYTNEKWNEKDEVEIEVETAIKDGKEYLNFKALSENAKIWIAINELRAEIAMLKTAKGDDIPVINDDEEIAPDDIPF